MNDAYKEFIENYAKISQLYKQHFEDMQKVKQEWFNLFWRSLVSQQQEQEQEMEGKEEG
jgi:hypothetical protein